MRIEVKGRNVDVTPEVREYAERRFRKIAKQVSEHATLELEVCHERNPSNIEPERARATLHLKGVTLCAQDSSGDLKHAIHLCEQELSRQVVRLRAKRRHRRDARKEAPRRATQGGTAAA